MEMALFLLAENMLIRLNEMRTCVELSVRLDTDLMYT